jgi:hypothetical protein
MELAVNILKNILLPQLDKDFNFDSSKINDYFLETISLALIAFENDAKPLYTIIYSLELKDAEKIISKLPLIYSTFIKELAEQYVLEYKNTLIDKLIESKNETFLKEVSFLKTMKAAITKSERKQLKKNLPQAYDRLVFELDEKTLEAVAKKKSREDLKDKFKQWDEELTEAEPPLASVEYSLSEDKEYKFDSNDTRNIHRNEEFVTYSAKSKRKVVSLSWIKYAAAACIVLTAGIMYFKFNTDINLVQPGDNNVVTTPNKEETITPEIPSVVLDEIATVTKNAPVIESHFGFATKKNTIKIIENNQNARMESLVIAIDKYRRILEDELNGREMGQGTTEIEIEKNIDSLQNELALLKEREKQYVFDGKSLVMYVSTAAKENTIVFYGDTYYLKKDSNYFKLTIAVQPQLYKKIGDSNLVNLLDEILDENCEVK